MQTNMCKPGNKARCIPCVHVRLATSGNTLLDSREGQGTNEGSKLRRFLRLQMGNFQIQMSVCIHVGGLWLNLLPYFVN